MHLTFTNVIPHSCKYFNSEVAASRSEVMPCGIVKLLLRSSEVKCSAYRAVRNTSRTKCASLAKHTSRSACGTLSSKNAPLSVDKSAFFVGGEGEI